MVLEPGGFSDPSPSPQDAVASVAAALRSQSDDLSLYAGFLFNTLEAALPASMVSIERRKKRLFGGGGAQPPVVRLTVVLGDQAFVLERADVGAAPRASIRHAVGGVVLRTDEVDLSTWVVQLSGGLVTLAGRNQGVQLALEGLLRDT